ncbi:hypothetical protein P152DRAFT_457927 [Eremomyces bilateralis CBS 781.70]|uniref:Cation efflux protein transmembrane domain-containing protein n=1 Tax=Eremomyces bilateralis CBS 781.70 TaxID=1392243 RepID=A0A6G1G421_9PEZI|nr:uncharacterized protein P152DRAFT_457927 [Eremomyces bilateralis CBS 781.70]KAF1812732.1 hypothetical protein P152DRAFT_457927 [Eremomyces bilateralis CBS 781.70]
MPLPIPPRTPTPPPDDGTDPHFEPYITPAEFNPDALSPLSGAFPSQKYGSLTAASSSVAPSPRSPLTPATGNSLYTPLAVPNDNEGLKSGTSDSFKNPFNFQTVQYTAGRAAPPNAAKSDLGRRRGHKYKHSSVSHQIILEPPPNRTPLQIPTSLPIPTMAEFRHSMSLDQRTRLVWCCCHLAVAGYVQWTSKGSLATTALSHLLFFDALGAFLCVAVDVARGFDVWGRSSVAHPFGLSRLEILTSLAMSVGLLFMGIDIISHSLTHSLEAVGPHEPHTDNHGSGHLRVPAYSIDFAAVAAIAASLVSATLLKNHARIGRTVKSSTLFSALPFTLPSILANPSHLLTLSCAALLLILPLLGLPITPFADAALAVLTAASMMTLGGRLCVALGRILLMSCPGAGGANAVHEVVEAIRRDDAVRDVEDARFWQVHYELSMANLKVAVEGRRKDEVPRLRERVVSLVRNRLGGGYGGGKGAIKWEVSVQVKLVSD